MTSPDDFPGPVGSVWTVAGCGDINYFAPGHVSTFVVLERECSSAFMGFVRVFSLDGVEYSMIQVGSLVAQHAVRVA